MDARELVAAEKVLAHGDPGAMLRPVLGGGVRRVERRELLVRPGRAVTLRLEVVADGASGPHTQGWVLAAGSHVRGSYQLRVRFEDEDCELQAWRVRDDPVLRGLRPCLEPDRVRGMLSGIGVPEGELHLTLRSVRPLRRAVVEVRMGQHVVFLKCVPPGRAAALHERHVLATAAGIPVPRSLGVDDTLGIVALAPLQGDALRELLLAEHRGAQGRGLCDPDEVLRAAAAFSSLALTAPARNLREVGLAHLTRLAWLLPDRGSQIEELALSVREAPPMEVVGVHGDFYDAQLVVRDGALTGVVDIDGAGRGERGSDEANLLAHLDVLGLIAPSAALTELRSELEERTRSIEGLGVLRGAALAGLAAWPHTQRLASWQLRTEEILDLAWRAAASPER